VNHPQRLGKYQITEVLGEGAMGVVYKGYDPDIRRSVALKTIRRELSDAADLDGGVAGRFVNEARAGGRLSHPGIVAVYDFGEDAGVKFIAMEYVDGQSLARYASGGVRFSDSDIPGVMIQLLDAIAHAHEQGVWHRDIKPANVIMTRAGRLKVADFGIARIDGSGLTQVTMLIGTPGYMAPEQFLGSAIDHRVDIYAAGVVLYLLLTGRLPFSGPSEALMYKVVHEPPLPPSAVEGVVRPRFYDALIATALAKDPAQRFASAAAFKQALVHAVGHPIDEAAWDKTIIAAAVPARAAVAVPDPGSVQASAGSGSSVGPAPTGWDRSVLAQAEAALAKHVGPLAAVLVRRAARDCSDLPALYAKLAEQITSATGRAAFWSQTSGLRGAPAAEGAVRLAGTAIGRETRLPVPPASSTKPVGEPASHPVAEPVGEALVAQATRALALQLGPIASAITKRAAAQHLPREAFFQTIAAAVTDPVRREKLLADLQQLR
jgi:serine/threonine-protein kinase